MSLDLRAHFSVFRDAAPGRIHLAAHSHHFWPDAACAAHAQALDEAARRADGKWDVVLGELVPRARRGIAAILNLREGASIAFAPNTHELVCRLLSALPIGRRAHVLTTDVEFHSFARQIARLAEDGLVSVERVPAEPFASFPARFCAAARHGHDLVFVSQVFYDSGATCGDLAEIARAVRSRESFVAIDGYHGFMALPTDLDAVAGRVFYLAGGYKYAMAGEGACFMHCPPGYAPRPRDTGWFAGFGALAEREGGAVGYAADGARFMGATFDPSGLWRLAAVLDWMDRIGLTVAAIHAHVMRLQERFLDAVRTGALPALARARLVTPVGTPDRGHFLSYETPEAEGIRARLAAAGIVTDRRGSRIRFGFGCYHAPDDIDQAVAAIARALG